MKPHQLCDSARFCAHKPQIISRIGCVLTYHACPVLQLYILCRVILVILRKRTIFDLCFSHIRTCWKSRAYNCKANFGHVYVLCYLSHFLYIQAHTIVSINWSGKQRWTNGECNVLYKVLLLLVGGVKKMFAWHLEINNAVAARGLVTKCMYAVFCCTGRVRKLRVLSVWRKLQVLSQFCFVLQDMRYFLRCSKYTGK